MEPGFSWTISGATIFAIIGWAISVLAFVWKRSDAEASQRNELRRAHERLEALDKRVAGLDVEIDTRVSALQAGGTLMREQMHEQREANARTYATRDEVQALDRRYSDTMARIMDRMDAIDGRLNAMQDKILAAIASMRGSN